MSGLVIVGISQIIHWKSKSDNIQRGYGFRYDQIDRLREAHYAAKPVNGTKWTIENGHYDVPEIRYDFNGNITKVKRAGWFNSGAFGLMDNLTYAYSGNQLSAVTDQITATGPDDFRDNGATSSLDYTYDLNGNMVTDANKGLTVGYNHLNLPERMNFGGGDEILLLYDAAGNKLAKRVKQGGSPQATRQYLAGFVYNGTQLEFFATPEGRVVPDASGPEDFRYEYHYRDHLGNTRLCFSDLDGDGDAEETEIMQELHYYPFGMTLNGLGTPQIGSPHLYGYSGKENQGEFGLGWNDFGARMYDASLGRWMVVDPLAERFVGWSPYNYVLNNPTLIVDPDGQAPEHKRNAKKLAKRTGGTLHKGKNGKWSVDYYDSDGNTMFSVIFQKGKAHSDLFDDPGDPGYHFADHLPWERKFAYWLENSLGGSRGEFGPQQGSVAETVGQEVGALVYTLYFGSLVAELITGRDGPELKTKAGIGLSYAMMFLSPGSIIKGGGGKLVKISRKQLQKKFKHAGKFGIKGHYNNANAEKLVAAFKAHIDDAGTHFIKGHYRNSNNPVYFYLNPNNGLNIIVKRSGEFVTAYKAEPHQVRSILTKSFGW